MKKKIECVCGIHQKLMHLPTFSSATNTQSKSLLDPQLAQYLQKHYFLIALLLLLLVYT